MIDRGELQHYLHSLLDCAAFSDYAPNGLQVEGKEKINKICTAVTASAEVIEQAIKQKADALFVHHGYFWKGESPEITGIKYQRIAKLIKHDINLFAYHLPLDCHPVYGNNAEIGRLLEIDTFQMLPVGKINNLLWSGLLPKALDANDFKNFLKQKFERSPLHIDIKDKPIRRVFWCSGGAQDYLEDAARAGADAYISGEISERTYYQALELGVHYFACGHHATERYGIQTLGQHLASSYALEHHYIDTKNPV